MSNDPTERPQLQHTPVEFNAMIPASKQMNKVKSGLLMSLTAWTAAGPVSPVVETSNVMGRCRRLAKKESRLTRALRLTKMNQNQLFVKKHEKKLEECALASSL